LPAANRFSRSIKSDTNRSYSASSTGSCFTIQLRAAIPTTAPSKCSHGSRLSSEKHNLLKNQAHFEEAALGATR
jgi:hypothetical protein